MKREVYWFQAATEALSQLSARNARQATRTLVAVREFGHSQRGDIKKLVGSDEWRLRGGDWRVFFILREDAVYVVRTSDRPGRLLTAREGRSRGQRTITSGSSNCTTAFPAAVRASSHRRECARSSIAHTPAS